MHTGIYSPLARGRGHREQRRGAGRRHLEPELLPHRPVLPEQGRPVREVLPEVLKTSRGPLPRRLRLITSRRWTATHIAEIPELIEKHGVTSFKIFMFYGSHGLHGRSDSQRDFLMIGADERYDFAHFEFVMRGVQAARERFRSKAAQISLSLHCETAEIMTAYTKIVEREGKLKGLAPTAPRGRRTPRAWRCSSPPIWRNETALPNINLLHLSSRKAVEAALQMAEVFPHIDFRREVTIGHLVLDYDSPAGVAGQGQSADPPARGRRVPLGDAAGGQDRLGGQRPRLLPARD